MNVTQTDVSAIGRVCDNIILCDYSVIDYLDVYMSCDIIMSVS